MPEVDSDIVDIVLVSLENKQKSILKFVTALNLNALKRGTFTQEIYGC